jgi:DNA-binding NarL/FixJ family response regulator
MTDLNRSDELPMLCRVIAVGVDDEVKRALEKFCARKDSAVQFEGAAKSITTLLFALEESQPEVVIVDEYSLGAEPVATLASIHHASPQSRLLVIGDTLDVWAIREVLQLGIAGNLRRAEACSQIWRAISTVKRGEFWLSRSQSSQLLSRLSGDEIREHGAMEDLEILTPQQNRVLQQCMAGQSNKEIAIALGISQQTVKIHLQQVFQKLGVRRRADLLLRRWPGLEKRPESRRSHR